MIRTSLLLSLLLSGCTFLLDPEVCSDKSDCDSLQVCEEGICLGPKDPDPDLGDTTDGGQADSDAVSMDSTPPTDTGDPADIAPDAVDPDMGDPTDMVTPDAPPTGIAPTCEIVDPAEQRDPYNEVELAAKVVVADDDEAEDQLTVTFAGDPITIDPESNEWSGVVTIEEGDNLLVLTALDSDNRSCRAERTVVGDFTAPVVELFDDVPIVSADAVKRIEGTVTEDHYTRRQFEVELNDEPIDAELAWDGAEFQFPIELEAGENDVSIVAIDDAGNASEPLDFVVIFDNESPVVVIDAPTPDEVIMGDATTVTGRVTKNGEPITLTVRAVARQGGEEAGRVRMGRSDADDEGRFSIRNVDLLVGNNTITVTATDPVTGTPGVATVNVVRQDPAPCVSFDDDIALVVGENGLELRGDYCPAVESIGLLIDGGGEPIPAMLDNLRWTAIVDLPAPGEFEVVAVARGGGAEARAMVDVLWDDSQPVVQITRPDAQDCVNGEMVQVCGRATDHESGILRVRINGVEAAVDVGGNFCHDTPVDEGDDQFIRARAVNGAGVFADSEIEIDVDRVAPAVTMDTPRLAWLGLDGTGRVRLRGQVDSGVCGLTRMTVAGSPVQVQRDGSFEARLELDEGDHVAEIVTFDRAGNTERTNYAFRIDSTDPEFDALLPEAQFLTPLDMFEIGARACDARSGIVVARIDGVEVEAEADGPCVTFTRVVAVPEGVTRYPIYIEDVVGLSETAEIVVSRDVTGPVVVVTSPEEGAAVAATAIVQGTVDDGEFGSGVDTITVAVGEADPVDALVDPDAGTWRAVVPLPGGGAQALSVVATDHAENIADPVVRNVVVNGYHARASETDGFDEATSVGWLGAADANRDGALDIIAITSDPDGTSALYNQLEDTTFAALDQAGLPSMGALRQAGQGDFDGDRRADLLVVGNLTNGVFAGDAAGAYAQVEMSGVPNGMSATGVALGDVDRDGALDALAFAGAGTRYLQGNGDGTFQRIPHDDLGLGAVNDAVAGTFVDVNDDGVLDLVAVSPAATRLWIGARDGTFVQAAPEDFAAGAATVVVPIDANRDGHLDLLTAGPGAEVRHGSSDGTFENQGPRGLVWEAGVDLGAVVLDFDGDTRDDLVVWGGAGPKFWRNTPEGFALQDVAAQGVPGDIGAVTAALAVDIDVDGDADLVLGTADGVRIIRSNLSVVNEDHNYVHLDILRAVEGDGAAPEGPYDAVGTLLYQDLNGDLTPDRVLVPAAVGPTLLTLGAAVLADATAKYVDKGEPGDRIRDVVELPASIRTNVLARE